MLKFIRSETGGVTPYGRESLEEFPEAPDPAPNEEPDAPIELPFDPEQIRQEIMEAARFDAEEKVKQAYQEGLARGTEAGRERFLASIAKSAEALEAAAESIREDHENFLNSLEPQVVGLVKLLARRVLDREIRTDPELVQHTARRALSRLAGQYAVTLLVNPADFDAIRMHEIKLLETVPGVESLHVVASDDIQPGGCIARSEEMEVDARLENLLAQVLDALTE